MSPSEGFPLTAGPNVPLPGYQGGTVGEDCSPCKDSTVLGGEVQPPMLGQPCLLARCILELRETMEQYVSFFNDTILDGVAPLDRFLEDWTRITIPRDAQPAFTDVPTEEVTVEEASPIGGPLRNQLLPRYHMRS